jgi:hypothetical protein
VGEWPENCDLLAKLPLGMVRVFRKSGVLSA